MRSVLSVFGLAVGCRGRYQAFMLVVSVLAEAEINFRNSTKLMRSQHKEHKGSRAALRAQTVNVQSTAKP